MAIIVPNSSERIAAANGLVNPTWLRFFLELVRLTNGKIDTSSIGTDVQAHDGDLDTIAGLTRDRGDLIRGGASAWEDFSAKTADTFVGGDGTDVTTRTAAQVRSSLGIASGTYTPTLTNTTNLSASTASTTGYLQVNDRVIVFGNVAADAVSAASTATQLDMSLPVSSSLTSFVQLAGIAAMHLATVTPIRITADATNDRASFNWASLTTANTNIGFIFAYQVL